MSQYTVKQLSDKLGISVHTIRFYDDQGLFPDVTRDHYKNRIFTEESLSWVNLVLCLRNTGMSISEIKHYINLCQEGDSTVMERYQIILDQKKKAEEDLKGMQKRLEVLAHKEKYYEELLAVRVLE
jgi:MerR family transcriptional regulator, aldehyde-responsive regulator